MGMISFRKRAVAKVEEKPKKTAPKKAKGK